MKKVDVKVKEAIDRYQCPGCVCEKDDFCYEKDEYGVGCKKHVPGTMATYIGTFFLGMPKGFNRLGMFSSGENRMKISMFESLEEKNKDWGVYDKFNVPVWKYVDEYGSTLVRGLSPRTNRPFLHIILEDCKDKIDCIEITKEDVEEMD